MVPGWQSWQRGSFTRSLHAESTAHRSTSSDFDGTRWAALHHMHSCQAWTMQALTSCFELDTLVDPCRECSSLPGQPSSQHNECPAAAQCTPPSCTTHGMHVQAAGTQIRAHQHVDAWRANTHKVNFCRCSDMRVTDRHFAATFFDLVGGGNPVQPLFFWLSCHHKSAHVCPQCLARPQP